MGRCYLHYAVYIVHYTVYRVQLTMYSVQRTLTSYSVHCISYIVQGTVYRVTIICFDTIRRIVYKWFIECMIHNNIRTANNILMHSALMCVLYNIA